MKSQIRNQRKIFIFQLCTYFEGLKTNFLYKIHYFRLKRWNLSTIYFKFQVFAQRSRRGYIFTLAPPEILLWKIFPGGAVPTPGLYWSWCLWWWNFLIVYIFNYFDVVKQKVSAKLHIIWMHLSINYNRRLPLSKFCFSRSLL